ncbi:hypothetical protein HY414_01100 [Candidatus Kaiserbacteria bacterium]|nr:hypothetical protein [Candidatus Kaiserbacteria bacterium]
MKYIRNFVTSASWFSLGISIAVVLLFGAVMAQGSSTISTNISTDGTLAVTGASTLTGNVTASGDISVGDDLTVTGTASSTDMRVGNDNVTTVSGIVFGFCSFADVTSFTASTTKFVSCTGATGVTSSYRVFVQATSSLESAFVIQSASSTATAGTIQLRVLNTDMDSNNGNTTLNGASINFWAVR